MKITSISTQARNQDRVNVAVDGGYSFSLDINQVVDLGIKVGREITDADLERLKSESEYGKLYMRALEWSLSRPRSARELDDYLYKKTIPRRDKTGKLQPGASAGVVNRVRQKLLDAGHVNDERFVKFWVDNRNVKKGMSRRALEAELRRKGIDDSLIAHAFATGDRSDEDELSKIIAKKKARYPDENKFKQYLMRKGFSYDDVKEALKSDDSPGF